MAVDRGIMVGKPCVEGTRIPVYVLLQKMCRRRERGREILAAYPLIDQSGPPGSAGVCSALGGGISRAFRILSALTIRRKSKRRLCALGEHNVQR
jgi:hypothetical protein